MAREVKAGNWLFRISDNQRVLQRASLGSSSYSHAWSAPNGERILDILAKHPDVEINFFRISEENVRKMIESEDLKFSIYGGKETIEDIHHPGFSRSLPFVWKQALATLMGEEVPEEVPEKKTLFGEIKGLFNYFLYNI